MARSSTPPSFIACPFAMVPPATKTQLQHVFDDIDVDCQGLLTRDQVMGAFAVNRVQLTDDEAGALLEAMDPGAANRITSERFVCCVYALSVTLREVSSRVAYSVFPDSEFGTFSTTGSLRLRRSIWLALEDPLSSRLATGTAAAIVGVVALSTACIFLETFPSVRNAGPAIFDALETACAVFFSVELLLRLLCTPYPRAFFFQFRNLVDLCAILPFYLTLLADAGTTSGSASVAVVRVVRVLRIVRLFKLGRYVTWMRVFARALSAAAPALGMLLFVSSLALVVFASVEYFAERGTWEAACSCWVDATGTPTQFQSIPATFWWALVTMSTVGYGDAYPVSLVGCLLATAVFGTGILLLAIPISVISNTFHAEYARVESLAQLRRDHKAQPAPDPYAPTPPYLATEADEQLVPRSSARERVNASWSEAFLRSALHVVRGNRRRLMSNLKKAELSSREAAVGEVRSFVSGIAEREQLRRALLRHPSAQTAAGAGGVDLAAASTLAGASGSGLA